MRSFGIFHDWTKTDPQGSITSNEIEIQYDEKGIIKPESAEKIIKETADELIYALSVKDSETISEFVHPVKGLRFTPYTHVSPERDIVFNVEQVKNFLKIKINTSGAITMAVERKSS